jgi:hypothetical protein
MTNSCTAHYLFGAVEKDAFNFLFGSLLAAFSSADVTLNQRVARLKNSKKGL